MIAIKVSLVAAVALALASMLRRHSAAARHSVLAAGIMCAGATPFLELFAPGWGTALASVAPRIMQDAGRGRDLLSLVWIAGVVVGFATLSIGLARLAWIRARGRRDVSPRWRVLVEDVAGEHAIGRPVSVIEHDTPVMPMTWGLARPTILLPRIAREWNDDRLRAVLRHELAHIKRGDWAIHLAAEIVTRALWFNPLLWIARRRLRVESERACDDAVLNLGMSGAEYAAHVMDVARVFRRERDGWTVAPAMARAGSLERRVEAALSRDIARAPVSPLAGVMTCAAFLTLTVAIAGFGAPSASHPASSLLDVQRDIMMRFGGEERRLSIVSRDVSFWTNRIEGRVELQAQLGVDGSLSGVRVVEPVHPDLASAAAVIVRQWRREPARVRGVPVQVPIRMTVDFRGSR